MSILPPLDYRWPSNNFIDIPALKADMEGGPVVGSICKWGTVSRKSHQENWHFYTDDYKFDGLWKNPQAVPATRCRAVCEVNWSTSESMPLVVQLYQIYRKRWLSRYWQENGVRIYVDLNVPANLIDTAFVGVPAGWSSYCSRGSDDDLFHLECAIERAKDHAGKDDITMIVVAGGKATRRLCDKEGCIFIHGSPMRRIVGPSWSMLPAPRQFYLGFDDKE